MRHFLHAIKCKSATLPPLLKFFAWTFKSAAQSSIVHCGKLQLTCCSSVRVKTYLLVTIWIYRENRRAFIFARVTGCRCDEKNPREKSKKKSSNSVWKSFLLRILTGKCIRTLFGFHLFPFWFQKGKEEQSSKRFQAGRSNYFVKELPLVILYNYSWTPLFQTIRGSEK